MGFSLQKSQHSRDPSKKLPNWCFWPSVGSYCYQASESLDHLFLHCPTASDFWSFLFKELDFASCMPRAVEDSLLKALQEGSPKGKPKSFGVVKLEPFFGAFGKKKNNSRVLNNRLHSFYFFCNCVQITLQLGA